MTAAFEIDGPPQAYFNSENGTPVAYVSYRYKANDPALLLRELASHLRSVPPDHMVVWRTRPKYLFVDEGLAEGYTLYYRMVTVPVPTTQPRLVPSQMEEDLCKLA